VRSFVVTLLAAVVFFVSCPVSDAGYSDQWLQLSEEAVGELAGGNPQATVGRTASKKNKSLGVNTRVSADEQPAALTQNVPVLDFKKMRVSGDYRLRSTQGTIREPQLGHQAVLKAQNQYMSDTTSFSPKAKRNNL
jgi:hypothetical protein